MKKFIFYFLFFIPFIYADDWGSYMHRHINGFAVENLPTSELKNFFLDNEEYLILLSTKADQRKRKIKEEGMKHFINLEALGINKNDNNLPQNWEKANEKWGNQLKKNGTAPWAILATYENLVSAFKEKKSALEIIEIAADLGHYIGDIHVPLHTTENYDGQLSDQHGIHALWESILPEMYYYAYRLKAQKPIYIKKKKDKIWEIIFDSHQLVPQVLAQEKLAAEKVGTENKLKPSKNPKKIAKNPRYSDDFILAYHKGLNGMIQTQTQKAVFNLSSFWYSAWVDAGKPNFKNINYGATELEDIEFE